MTLLEAACSLGMAIKRYRQEKKMKITQSKYVKDVIKRFGLERLSPWSPPIGLLMKVEKGKSRKRR
eukprot:CAMPEP_0175074522 /NCGR_PEP_ID=MMETSP0052_2-20121109/21368_1 /TAXON_ID=51329 ORGANISM="Polytomella parva, Strain SAG 63-3" /NCGR_SAMPLE_ID=MMETSP0052_2 /ASSEMBLY_ACC=CAM_ASM_000194 /LENGTH=65 /DNA_ID=CAMNT_0016342859 /DNA_START=2076 /DNA_END=2273 /DNA_ORIENTATION=-